jgi:hypothetical protein
MKKEDVRRAQMCVVHFTIYETVSHHIEKLRHAIRVTHLILDDCLSYSNTNRRHMFSETRL